MTYPQYTQQSPPMSGAGPTDGSSADSSMSENAAQAAQQGKQAVGEVAQSATERAGEVKDEAVRQARDLIGEARNQVSQQAGQGHQALVSNLRSLGDELDRMSRQSGESGVATELAGQAQQRVVSLASWLESRQPDQILDEVRSFARRRPGTFLIGAVAAGVVAGRLARGTIDVHTNADTTDGTSGASQAAHRPEPAYSPPSYSTPPVDATPAYPPAVGSAPPYAAPAGSAPSYSPPVGEPTQTLPNNGSWQ